ncbi:hypothetical protein GCK32_003598 [Trichostrongylus colubriformis]|uniref:Uncharacterized protein n=1 Tax=Trichostrongylus colubriformis TaxID=6319 RepID=A0AAN8FWZ9_TRICO
MSRTKIEELVQLEAEQRLDELRSIRNELAMMHCTIMEMRTRSITTEEMVSTLRAEVMDFKKADHAKCTVVLKDSSCGTEVPTTVDASTDNGITYTNASTSTEEPQMKHVSVAVEPAQVHVGIKTDEVETSDALVDMGITTSDVAVMVFPKIRNVEVSASPRMKNTSTNTVVKVSRHPSPAPRNETQGTLGKSTFASMTNLPCFTTSSCPNSEHELKKDKAVDDHASDDQPSRKRKATDGIVEQCKRSPDQEEQRVKILEKIKTFERFIAKTRKRKFGGQAYEDSLCNSGNRSPRRFGTRNTIRLNERNHYCNGWSASVDCLLASVVRREITYSLSTSLTLQIFLYSKPYSEESYVQSTIVVFLQIHMYCLL